MKLFIITTIVSVTLIVAGFLLPPTGIIDGSVLTAVGELMGFGVIAQLPEAVKAGRSVRIKTRDCEVDVTSEENEKNKDS